jgi:hypothetical protein
LASTQEYADYVVEQIDNAGLITEGGREFIKDVVEAPAFKGAKLSFLIGDQIEDREWISTLVRITREELPVPKPKRKSKN